MDVYYDVDRYTLVPVLSTRRTHYIGFIRIICSRKRSYTRKLPCLVKKKKKKVSIIITHANVLSVSSI